MAFAEDLAPFFSLNEFAVTASFAGGQARVIFEQPYSSQFGGAVDSEQPMCLAPSADIAALGAGQQLVVGADSYTVDRIEPDGSGLSRIVMYRNH